MTATQNLKM